MPLYPVGAKRGALSCLDVTVPIEPKVQSQPGYRDPALLAMIVDHLDLPGNPRYAIRDTSGDGKPDTFCNIAAVDFARCMGVVLPRVWPGPEGWRELSANGLADWLPGDGLGYGWSRASELEARFAANLGQPALAVFKNAEGPGHVAIVLPTAAGEELLIAQAGKRNFMGQPLVRGFGGVVPAFYIHP